MKLIAHIGHGKTGSSSVQKTLANNSHALDNASTFYLGLNMELSPFKSYDWQKSSTWNMLLQIDKTQAIKELSHVLHQSLIKLNEKGYKKVIWSNESLLVSPQIVIPALQSIKAHGFDVDVIVYLRRHDSWLRSAYLQWAIKHKASKGIVKPFSEWRERSLNYMHILAPWNAENWNDLYIRNFDACNDLLTDFLQCCDIDNNDFVNERSNDTPENVALNLWALFNSQSEGPVLPHELQGLLTKTKVINKKYKQVDLNNLYPSKDDLLEVLQDCQADIKQINTVFNEYSQPEFNDIPLREKDYNVGTGELISALLDMIKSQHEDISSLERRMLKVERHLKV